MGYRGVHADDIGNPGHFRPTLRPYINRAGLAVIIGDAGGNSGLAGISAAGHTSSER
jgi:hypothetical protein